METAVLPKDLSQPLGAEEAGVSTDKAVLQHLLNLEAEAAALVDDAQAEADRRVGEGEKQSRSRYDETYAAEVAALEASYTSEIAAVKDDYKKQLANDRDSLKAMPVNRSAFSALAEHLLFEIKEK
jgi:regulator of protease activity HflC (stomatin/prohibitin superfamily)